MAIPLADLGQTDESHLLRLIGQAETETLEFKRDHYARDDQAKREFCKDLVALANASGGDLILGIEEKDHEAIALVGLPKNGIGEEVQRLQNLALDAIEPRILGLKFHTIDLASGRSVLVVRVPRSFDVPHRVTQNNSNRFFVRRSNQAVEATLLELRRMFEVSGSQFANAEEFRTGRVQRLATGREPYPLSNKEEGVYMLHLIPFGYSQRSVAVDLSLLDASSNSLHFLPVENTGGNRFFSADGFVWRSSGNDCISYTAVGRDGTVESARSSIFLSQRLNDGSPAIHGQTLMREISQGIAQYVTGLLKLGASGPWTVLVTLWNCEGAKLTVSSGVWEWASFGRPIAETDVVLPSMLVDQRHGTFEAAQEILRPMFDALWQMAGKSGLGTN